MTTTSTWPGRANLGRLFDPDDYPPKEALAQKFRIRYQVTPVENARHFLARLAADDGSSGRSGMSPNTEGGRLLQPTA